MYDTIKIGDQEFPFKLVYRILMSAMRKRGISLKSLEEGFADLDFLYETIFQAIRYASNRYSLDFKYKENKEEFFWFLDDHPEDLETISEAITNAFETMEGDAQKKSKPKEKK